MILAIFITILLAWVMFFPLDALNLIRKWRAQHRQKVIQRHGQIGAAILSHQLHSWANEQGFDPNLVDEILAEHHDLIVHRLGEKQAQEILSD